jgi:enoyl-CoA hydratase/carnithine racemase
MTGHVHYHPADAQGIAQIVFDNPGKLNALDVPMWRELRDVVVKQVPENAPLVIVLRGEGHSFVAGGDIEEFPNFRFDPDTLAHFHEDVVAPALWALLACDVPLVAQIAGACVGGGLEIAACCDIRLCGENSRFGVPIAKLGFPMAPAEVEIVARVVGETTLRELLLEGRVLTAPEALARGLVTRIVADADLAREVERTTTHMASLSPQALRMNKQALRQFARGGQSGRDERLPHYQYAPTAEHREGLAAFNEKRPAQFTSVPSAPPAA